MRDLIICDCPRSCDG